MASTSERMLRLLSLLQSHRDWSGADLAERLEVSPRTLRRDIDRLRLLGYPVDATPGVDGGYRLAAGAALPPLVLDDDEAVALVIALRSSATLAISGAAEASVNALAKVVQVLPARLRQRAESVASMTVTAEWSDTLAAVDAGTLATLATTARNVERVEFSYRDRESNTQDRLVEPAQLVMLGRRWYLVAYDVNRHDWRTFRVDRISEPRATGRHFQPKPIPTGDAADYVRSSISLATPSVDIVVVIEAPASDVRHRFGNWATVTEVDPDRCRLVVS
ncbi:MAG: YafY family protein, partial [Ilumatobacteraceae bacterium]